MANTGRILLEATVTDVGIGPFVYPACGQCYSKLVFVRLQDCQLHRCQNCGRSYSYGQEQFRYRLCLTVTDGTAVASLTSFGGMLNSFFGVPATQFHMLMSTAEAKFGTSYASIMQVAIEQAFVGQRLLFGLKTVLSATRHKYSQRPNTHSAFTLRDICQSAITSSQKSIGRHSPDLIAVQIMPVTDSSFSATVVDCLQNLETMIETYGLTPDAITDRTVLLQMLSLCRLSKGNRSYSISNSFVRQADQSPPGLSTKHVSWLPGANTSCNATVDSSFDQPSLAFSCDDSLGTIFVPGKAGLMVCANHDLDLAVCANHDPDLAVCANHDPDLAVCANHDPDLAVCANHDPDLAVCAHHDSDLAVCANLDPDLAVCANLDPDLAVCANHDPDLAVCLPRLDVSAVDQGNKLKSPCKYEESVKCYSFCHEDENGNSEVRKCLTLQQISNSEGILRKRQCELAGVHKCEPRNAGGFVNSKLCGEYKNLPETVCGQVNVSKLKIVDGQCEMHAVKKMCSQSGGIKCHHGGVPKHTVETACFQNEEGRHDVKTVCGQSRVGRDIVKTACDLDKLSNRTLCVQCNVDRHKKTVCSHSDINRQNAKTVHGQSGLNRHRMKAVCKQKDTSGLSCVCTLTSGKLQHGYFQGDCTAKDTKTLENKENVSRDFHTTTTPCQKWQPKQRPAASYCDLSVPDSPLAVKKVLQCKRRRLRKKLIETHGFCVGDSLSSGTEELTATSCPLKVKDRDVEMCGLSDSHTGLNLTADSPEQSQQKVHSKHIQLRLVHSDQNTVDAVLDNEMSYNLDTVADEKCKLQSYNKKICAAGKVPRITEFEDIPVELMEEYASRVTEEYLSKSMEVTSSKFVEGYPESEGLDVFMSKIREENPSKVMEGAPSQLWEDYLELGRLNVSLSPFRQDNPLKLSDENPTKLQEDIPLKLRGDNPSAFMRNAQSNLRNNYLECESLDAFLPKLKENNTSKLMEDYPSELMEDYLESDELDVFLPPIGADKLSKLTEDFSSTLMEGFPESEGFDAFMSKLREDNSSKLSEGSTSKLRENNTSELIENTSKLRGGNASKLRQDNTSKLMEDYPSELMKEYPESEDHDFHLLSLRGDNTSHLRDSCPSILRGKCPSELMEEYPGSVGLDGSLTELNSSAADYSNLQSQSITTEKSRNGMLTKKPNVTFIGSTDYRKITNSVHDCVMLRCEKVDNVELATSTTIQPSVDLVDMCDLDQAKKQALSQILKDSQKQSAFQSDKSCKIIDIYAEITPLQEPGVTQGCKTTFAQNMSQDVQSLRNHSISQDIQSPRSHRASQDIQSLRNHSTSQDIHSPKNHRTSQDIHSPKNHSTSQDIHSPKNHRTSQDIQSLRNHTTSQDIPSLKNHRTTQNVQSLRNHRTSQDIHSPKNHRTSQDIDSLKNHRTSQDIHSLKNHRTSQDIQSLRNHSTSQQRHSLKSHRTSQNIHSLRSRGVSENIKIVIKRDAAKNIKPLMKQNVSRDVKSFVKQDVSKTDKNTEKQTLFQAVKACHRTSKDVKNVKKHKLHRSVRNLQAKIAFENNEKPYKTPAVNTPLKVADSQVCNDSEKLFSSKTVGSLNEQPLFLTVENPNIQTSFHIVTDTEKEMSLQNIKHSADQTLTREAVNSVKTSNRYEIEKNSERQALVGKVTNRKKHVLWNSSRHQKNNTLPQLNINGMKQTFLQRGTCLGEQPDMSSVTTQIKCPSQQTVPRSKKQVFSVNCTTPKQVQQHFKTPTKGDLLSKYTPMKTPQLNGKNVGKIKQSLNSTNIKQQTSVKVKSSTGNILLSKYATPHQLAPLRNCKEVQRKVFLNYATPKGNLQQNIKNSKKMLSSNYATPKENLQQNIKNSKKMLSSNYATPKENFQQNTKTSKKTLSSNYATPRQQPYPKNLPSSREYVHAVSGTVSKSHISLGENINAQNSSLTIDCKSTGKGVLELPGNTSVTEYGSLSIDLHAMSMNVTLRRSKRKYHTDKLDDKSGMNLVGCEQVSTETSFSDQVNDDTCALVERPKGKMSRLSDLDPCSASEDLFQVTDGSFLDESCFYERNSDRSFQRDSSNMSDKNLQKVSSHMFYRIVRNDSRSRDDRPESSSNFHIDSTRLSDRNVEKDSSNMSDKSILKDSTGLSHINVQKDGPSLSDINVQKDDPSLSHSNVQKDGPSLSHSNVQKDSDSLSHSNVQKDSDSLSHSNVQKDGPSLSHSNVQKGSDSLSHCNVQKDSTGWSHNNVQKDGPSLSDINVQKDGPSLSHINVQKDGPSLSHINVQKDGPSLSDINVQKDGPSLSHSNVQKDGPSLSHSNVQKDGPSLSHINVQKDGPSLSDINVQKDGPSLSHSNVQKDGPSLSDINVQKDGPSLSHSNVQKDSDSLSHCNVQKDSIGLFHSNVQKDIIGLFHSNVQKDSTCLSHNNVQEKNKFANRQHTCSTSGDCNTEIMDVNNQITKITDVNVHAREITDMDHHIVEILNVNDSVAEITDFGDCLAQISEKSNEVTESTDVNNKVTKITDMCNHMAKITDMCNHITEIIGINNSVAESTDKPNIITETSLLKDSGCSEVLWGCTDYDIGNRSSLTEVDIRSQNISSIQQFELVVAQLSCENSQHYNHYEHISPLPADSGKPLICDACPNRENGKSLIYDMESVKASLDSGLSPKKLQPSEPAFSSQAIIYLSADVDQVSSSNVGQVLSDSLSDLFSSQDEDSVFVSDTSHNSTFGREACVDVVQKKLLVTKSNMVSVRLEESFSELKYNTSVNGLCQRGECESVVSESLLLQETNLASDECEHSYSKIQLRNVSRREQGTKQVRFSDNNLEHSYFTFETISHLPIVNQDMYHLKSALKKDSTDWDPVGSQDLFSEPSQDFASADVSMQVEPGSHYPYNAWDLSGELFSQTPEKFDRKCVLLTHNITTTSIEPVPFNTDSRSVSPIGGILVCSPPEPLLDDQSFDLFTPSPLNRNKTNSASLFSPEIGSYPVEVCMTPDLFS